MKNVNMINSEIQSKIKNIVSSSWKTYSTHALYLTNIFLLLFIILTVVTLIMPINIFINPIQIFDYLNDLSLTIFTISFTLFIIGIWLGIINISLLLHREQDCNMYMLFSSFNLLFKYLVGSILLSLPFIIILQFFGQYLLNNNIAIIFIISRLIIIFVFQFYITTIVDTACDPIYALKKSYHMVINNINILLLIWLLILILNIVIIILTAGIGLIITLPLSVICHTKLYLLIDESETL